MRFALSGISGKNLEEICSKVEGFGFNAVGLWCGQLEEMNLNIADLSSWQKVKSVFSERGIKIAELGVYNNIIHPDKELRQKNIEYNKKIIQGASIVGCPAVITGSGSMNPKGDWFAHPKNYTPEVWQILVESLKEITQIAEQEKVFLSLEPHTVTPLGSVERLQKIIQDVGSDYLKIHMDPVNMVTYETYFCTGKLLNYMFDVLGKFIEGAHAKDVYLEDRLIVHLNETYASNGNLDYETYLRGLDQLDENIFLTLEHTEESLIPKARDYILDKAEKIGVSFK